MLRRLARRGRRPSAHGVSPGDFSFDEQVTGEELLDLFADLRGIGDRGFARSLADRFEADLRRPLGELSRGNRQKIGLIQALVHRPPLVVMDEPTAGLDPFMQEEFARLVCELRGAGTTVFLSSHNLAEVERMCDRVGILREGRLVAVESVDAITGSALRHVRLRSAEAAPAGEFRRLEGVSALTVDGPELRFLLRLGNRGRARPGVRRRPGRRRGPVGRSRLRALRASRRRMSGRRPGGP